MLAFLAVEAHARRRAIEQLAPSELADLAVVYGLRRLLASDRDVAVRALAAGALGSVRSSAVLPDPVAWLVDALGDISPVVRDAAIRALARHAAIAAHASLCTLARTDTTWWVRRAALYALGVIGAAGTTDPIAPARAALTDPFWRVRHAAVQVLAIYGNRSPERRPEILADVSELGGGTTDYLRSLWGPTLLEDPAPTPIPSRLPPALLDRDPAVVTARLATMDNPPPLGLVELLCDPHVPLRTLAAARLIEADDANAFAAALNWLDEPRIPHVAATVTTLLDTLGDPARTLVTRVLSAPARPGASRWAIGWVVATRALDLAELAWQRALEIDARALAFPIAPASALVEALGSSNAASNAGPSNAGSSNPGSANTHASASTDLAIAAADELLLRPASVRREILAAIPPHSSSAVRMRLAAAAHDGPHVDAALACADPLARATALAHVGTGISVETRGAALADSDPAVREALIAHASVSELEALLHVERDPWIRRAASRALVASLRRAPSHASTSHASTSPSHTLALRLAGDADEWIRTIAIPHLDPARVEHLARIVELAADPSTMVQSAIVEILATISDEQLLAATPTAAIDAWLAAGTATPQLSSTPIAVRNVVEPVIDRVVAPITSVVRRPFGSSGVTTAPLVVSGAFDLQPGSLRAAAERGVTTYFWEPAYSGMTRFLRARSERDRSQVVTGTYHADGPSIAKDVDRALRRLRRDALDVFLLFWSRSDARLDEEAFAVMDGLKRAGKVRAVGFSTHDRKLAMRALDRSPWDVVMTRHSAAHPGIEDAMLAHVQARGAGVLTFSALCYGRMLAGDGAPTATECYRYSLAQPGVSATISAPRRHRELIENLDVMTAEAMTEEEMTRVRAHGAGVRVESQRFNALIRQPTRDAAAAAMAMLEEQLAPGDGDRDEACVTPAALQRSLGSRGRGRASLPSAMLRRGRL